MKKKLVKEEKMLSIKVLECSAILVVIKPGVELSENPNY